MCCRFWIVRLAFNSCRWMSFGTIFRCRITTAVSTGRNWTTGNVTTTNKGIMESRIWGISITTATTTCCSSVGQLAASSGGVGNDQGKQMEDAATVAVDPISTRSAISGSKTTDENDDNNPGKDSSSLVILTC